MDDRSKKGAQWPQAAGPGFGWTGFSFDTPPNGTPVFCGGNIQQPVVSGGGLGTLFDHSPNSLRKMSDTIRNLSKVDGLHVPSKMRLMLELFESLAGEDPKSQTPEDVLKRANTLGHYAYSKLNELTKEGILVKDSRGYLLTPLARKCLAEDPLLKTYFEGVRQNLEEILKVPKIEVLTRKSTDGSKVDYAQISWQRLTQYGGNYLRPLMYEQVARDLKSMEGWNPLCVPKAEEIPFVTRKSFPLSYREKQSAWDVLFDAIIGSLNRSMGTSSQVKLMLKLLELGVVEYRRYEDTFQGLFLSPRFCELLIDLMPKAGAEFARILAGCRVSHEGLNNEGDFLELKFDPQNGSLLGLHFIQNIRRGEEIEVKSGRVSPYMREPENKPSLIMRLDYTQMEKETKEAFGKLADELVAELLAKKN